MNNSPIRSIAVLMLASAAACATGTVAPEAAPAPVSAASFTAHTYTGSAGTREYRLFVPAGYRAARPAPLIVMLHGCTQDAADFARGTRMNELAEAAGALVLYPEQPAAANAQKCWNWYDPAHQQRGAGEPAIVAGLTRQVMGEYGIDPRRVYVAGISAGGALATTLAATYPDLYAAAAVHASLPYGVARSVPEALVAMRGATRPTNAGAAVVAAMGEHARPVPLLVMHGAGDPVVNPANATYTVQQWVEAAALLGGTPPVVATETDSTAGGRRLMRVLYTDPAGRTVVESVTVEGLGHAWSAGAPEGTYTDPLGPDASRETLRFFLEHPREER